MSEVPQPDEDRLPPFPEDKLVLGGDLLSLSLYGFLDHFVGQLCVPSLQEIQPVWSAVPLENPAPALYSPLLEPVGLATILLLTSWLLVGWWHETYSYRNTASAERLLTKSGQTWLTSSAGLVVLTWLSRGDAGFLTQGDLSFLLDSLSVVVSWRFLWVLIMGRWW